MLPDLKAFLITVDVEDWFQVENLRPWFPPKSWSSQELRVEQNVHRILNLLDSIDLSGAKHQPKLRGTFFILGWIAERLPDLVREIQRRGHEVASHGYNHLMCSQMDPKDLEQDLTRSKKTIEDIAGVQVEGYRAPNFSISDRVLELVRDTGYRYDSSYNSFSKHGRYGTITINGNHRIGSVFKIGDNFMELPISNLNIGSHIIPWGGGGYFRLIPPVIYNRGIQRILKNTGVYMFYMHPWEIDPDQPRLKEANGLSTWRHYLNLGKTFQRLNNLISTFKHCRFLTCSQYLDKVYRPTNANPDTVTDLAEHNANVGAD